MSRSYHTTRKDVEQAYEKVNDGDELRIQEYEKLREEYYNKRRAKSQVKEQRFTGQIKQIGVSIDALSIITESSSEYLHFPASEQDIRALLKRMPQGLIDGLSRITLCLGKFQQRSPEESYCDQPEEDPYLGRRGYKVFGSIYGPSTLGTYFLNKNEIKLYGYIYDPGIEHRELWKFYLRLHMLDTFIHELAHHYDFTNRVARGKWRMDDVKKGEIYAEKIAHAWTREYVIPYLQEVYSDQYDQLNNWMKANAGVVINLSLLAGDCRSTTKKDTIRISSFFKTSFAFEEFVKDVLDGVDSISSRVSLSRELHYSGEYGVSLEILDRVLVETSKNIDAFALYGDILEHLGKYSESVEYAKKALRLDKSDYNAHHVLCDSYAGLKEWELALKWACKGLSIAGNKLRYRFFLRSKMIAELNLEKYVEAKKTVSEIKELYVTRIVPKSIQEFESEIDKNLKEK